MSFDLSEHVEASSNSSEHKLIATIAVLDLEVTNLPQLNFNKTSITEMCMYAFEAKELKYKKPTDQKPIAPRILHKLNLLFNPQRLVDPVAGQLTGLNNYMLEQVSPFNENAAATIMGFLRHLPQPICLVAHNGWQFDFPILKKALKKFENNLSNDLICVDSLRAFMEIDEQREREENAAANEDIDLPRIPELVCDTDTKTETNDGIDFQKLNENTPKRRTLQYNANALKRKQSSDDEEITNLALKKFKSRRALFQSMSCANIKKFPKKDVYKLGNMYERVFKEYPKNAHRAEADVIMLTKLIQYYGAEFLDFAETQAIPFDDSKAS